MKAKDGNRVSVLRFLLSSIQNREIEKKEPLDDEEVLAEITSSAKRRRESMEAFKEGDRMDLVEKEAAELAILQEYLPDRSANVFSKVKYNIPFIIVFQPIGYIYCFSIMCKC